MVKAVTRILHHFKNLTSFSLFLDFQIAYDNFVLYDNFVDCNCASKEWRADMMFTWNATIGKLGVGIVRWQGLAYMIGADCF